MKQKRDTLFDFTRILVAVLMATFIACLFFAMALDMWWESDSPEHIFSAAQLEGYGLETILFYGISRFAEEPFLQMLFAVYETVLIMLTWLFSQKFIDKFFDVNRWLNLLIATGLIFLTSIYIPRYAPYFYRFSLGTQPWHNSTQLGMRLFALLSLYFFLEKYPSYRDGLSWRDWWTMSLLLAVSAMFKPNFMMSFCAALGFVMVIDFAGNANLRQARRCLFLGSVIVPALVVLTVQYFLIYVSGIDSTSSGIRLVFFSKLLWEGSPQHMIVKIGRDMGFPCLVMAIAMYFRHTGRDEEFVRKHLKNICFSILLYIMSLVIYSLFQESGPRARHGNFGWGTLTSYFTMFAYLVPFFIQSMREYRRQWLEKGQRSAVLDIAFLSGTVVLLLHFASGLCYFGTTLSGLSYYR